MNVQDEIDNYDDDSYDMQIDSAGGSSTSAVRRRTTQEEEPRHVEPPQLNKAPPQIAPMKMPPGIGKLNLSAIPPAGKPEDEEMK